MTQESSLVRTRGVGSSILVLAIACTVAVGAGTLRAGVGALQSETAVEVLTSDLIHFDPKDPARESRDAVRVLDNGRVIRTTVDLPLLMGPTRITADVVVRPIPKDELDLHDKWDRAGSIRLVADGQPDLEIVKFITAYGGRTEWSVDVSHLAPLLQGPVTVAAFIDTWVSPAWRVDLTLRYLPDSALPAYHWVEPLFLKDAFTREAYADSGIAVSTAIPSGQQRVLLYYLVSGHCTDGRDADEFVRKDNVIAVDGGVVYRFRPWRDDCRRFRGINPYTRRWSDGWWSSDYSRSGWCPGDWVRPVVLDLSDHLAAGVHRLRFRIENVRPRDDEGHYGYWRVSAFLVGVTDPR